MTLILYQDETKKALKNFKITGQPFSLQLAKDIALVKIACAYANKITKNLEEKIANAIITAAQELIDGQYDEQIVVDQIQGGAGTSMNMNVNEIIASRATEILNNTITVHPIDHVNRAQSTNDVVPTAMKITTLRLLDKLIETYRTFWKETKNRGEEFRNILKAGRTHLQDAVPITLGQEFLAHASMINRDLNRLLKSKETLYAVNLGGTAVGTGVNASEEFRKIAVKWLTDNTKYPLYSANNLIDATQYADAFMEVSAMLMVIAANLIKFMNDLRLLASGPRAGLGEISFLPRQKGSSIMPGKVNPIMVETVNQTCFQIIGNNQTIFMAVQAGQLELNVMLPIVAKNLFESLTILNNSLAQFVRYGIKKIIANREQCLRLFENSMVVATALTPKLGYDKVAMYVQKAINEQKTLKTILMEDCKLSEEEYTNLIIQY